MTQTRKVMVVLDAAFGERLHDIWPGQPVWIVLSPTNQPVVHALWKSAPGGDHLKGVTGFDYHDQEAPEGAFLNVLDDIDLHHGPYSSSTSYTTLTVVGARLTPPIRVALVELGFSSFDELADGFTATRSEEAAVRLRS